MKMLEITNQKCPHCGSTIKACLGVTSSADYTCLSVYPIGSINYVHACVDCGTIYLPEQYREEIRKKLEGK